jgi:hypothetical protein
VVSLIMFFVSLFLWYIGSFFTYGYPSMTRNDWYYLAIVVQLLFILTLITSALSLARFAKKWTYYATVFLFTTSMILLFVESLRPFF